MPIQRVLVVDVGGADGSAEAVLEGEGCEDACYEPVDGHSEDGTPCVFVGDEATCGDEGGIGEAAEGDEWEVEDAARSIGEGPRPPFEFGSLAHTATEDERLW